MNVVYPILYNRSQSVYMIYTGSVFTKSVCSSTNISKVSQYCDNLGLIILLYNLATHGNILIPPQLRGSYIQVLDIL